MEIITSLVFLIGLIIIVRTYKNGEKLSLIDTVKKAFPKYKIIEKHKTIMICEINQGRNVLI